MRIHLPPLRSRQEDIRQLAEYFLQNIVHQKHRPPLKLSEEAARVFETYPWPGNVRELERTIERASVLATADVLLPKDIPLGQVSVLPAESIANEDDNTVENALESLFNAATMNPSIELLPWLEREFTLRAMRKTNNNQVRAAKLLGITRATLRKRLERNGALKVAKEE